MPLQNRVTPQGHIISTSARGDWLGNRGVIHNAGKQIVRPYKIKAWIICMLHFRGRHREVMTPDRWTELFFLDEATAFSAGHRPCFQCRYADHVRFKAAWLKGNPQYGFTDKTSIIEIDNILQKERIDRKGNKVTYTALAQSLPDGAFIGIDGDPYLIANGQMYGWSPFGYGKGLALPAGKAVTVLTPASIVNAFGAGYKPQMGV
ncbi:hypothetical protein HQ865_02065 [Mucilaginibacter mali]|uniref:Uncharacterized protein n=1 Tax=Mucilaginibacter mali TaxID=2740462 RepID=A0A7D4QHQ2_9SPHI|nr:hypothetical protein [Mucilaginibacter mali]QKJ28590.1 hypothetical protein HQ865_02065 [Mucilaginibacter mali]